VLVKLAEEASEIGVQGQCEFFHIDISAYSLCIGYCVAQVHVIFAIPRQVVDVVFPEGTQLEHHFAYVEWFKPFSDAPESHHKMYKVMRNMKDGERVVSIIPISAI
jgi:hypothetical protein